MRTVVIYKSESGTTKQYAAWIKEEYPDYDIFSVEEFDKANLNDYERIIYSSSTYRGVIIGKDYLINNWELMKSKEVYLLVVGMIPMNTPWSEKSYMAIPEQIRNDLSGYVKIPGKNPEPEKKTGKFEGMMMKWFMKVDPKEVDNQPGVQKDNLKPVFDWLSDSHDN